MAHAKSRRGRQVVHAMMCGAKNSFATTFPVMALSTHFFRHRTDAMRNCLQACRWRLILVMLLLAPAAAFGQSDVRPFNSDWRFARGEQPESARRLDFDDSGWQVVRLPHDWAIAGPFDAAGRGSSGKLPWQGVGWYRRTFRLESAAAGRRVYFDFDGVMAFPKVYVTGRIAGQWASGYMSFRIDATPYVKFGERNLVAVEVDTRRHGTRWYPGAGIYRKVTMTLSDPVHIAHWGTFVTTPNVTDARSTVRVRSTIENHTGDVRKVEVAVILFDPDGRQVVTTRKGDSVPGNGTIEVDQQAFIPNPQRWDINTPNLYTAVTKVSSGGEEVDSDETSFGIRSFSFTADDGFLLNGRRVQLRGVNLHHDQGPLGAAFYIRAMERQLEIMKDMGANALRTSHNPPAPEVLDLCDRMGFFVWDEAFDKWNATADWLGSSEGITKHADRQLTNMVRRDRNHPSVFVWSIGNEIGNSPDDKGDGKSFGRLESMRESILKHDTTRPVAMGCHIPDTVAQPIFEPLDLAGWNYTRRYARMREMYPEKPILYSESASTVSTRGYYALPLATGKTDYPGDRSYVSSYDLSATAWSDIPDREFELMEKDRFVGGEFVWTGFDYLGEPTPFTREARSSYFGIVDLVGIPKDRFYLYRSYWRPEVATIHILPHWNWPDRVGKPVPVFVYTNGDSAELFLNGRSLGRRTKGEVPLKPKNLAQDKPLTSDGLGGDPSYQVDLGSIVQIRFLTILLAQGTASGGYQVLVSPDQSSWTALVNVAAQERPGRLEQGGPSEMHYEVDARARYVKVVLPGSFDAKAAVGEIRAYSSRSEPEYYDATYKYRLRWNDVLYEPGELRVVVYKNGVRIGEATMRTAGPPAAIRLTPDRSALSATGRDLAYILVEAYDDQGNPCPLADNLIQFDVQGPAEIAGVGNGDQLSLEPFQADHRKLFFGKAMLILRTVADKEGAIRVIARSQGLQPATATLLSRGD